MVINHFQLAKLLLSKYLQDNKRGELSDKRNNSKSEIRNKGSAWASAHDSCRVDHQQKERDTRSVQRCG